MYFQSILFNQFASREKHTSQKLYGNTVRGEEKCSDYCRTHTEKVGKP